MDDLFDPPHAFEPLGLPGADVSYLREFDLGMPPDRMMRALIDETPWRQENVTVWNRTYPQPRLVAWYGDPGRSYRYSGITLDPLPWAERISGIRIRVEAVVKRSFNSVLLNYYRDQTDSMGLHSDNEKALGPRPVIASVSMGAERALLFKSRRDPAAKTVKLPLASGSLLLMQGDTQDNYRHGIGKQTGALGPRVNLTFRTIRT